jgi:hypothetical protein
MKHIAPFLGFFEVIIWLLAIGQIMQQLVNFSHLKYFHLHTTFLLKKASLLNGLKSFSL